MNSVDLLLTKIDDLQTPAGATFLIVGTIVFLVPAIMFTIRGITDKRSVMFAIHVILLALWVRIITTNASGYLDALQFALRDMTTLMVSALALAGSVLLWYVVICRCFPKKN